MKVIFYKKASEINNVKSAICLAHLYDNIFLYYIKNYKIHNSKFYASYMKNLNIKNILIIFMENVILLPVLNVIHGLNK